jgi:hypothetical protein
VNWCSKAFVRPGTGAGYLFTQSSKAALVNNLALMMERKESSSEGGSVSGADR